MSDEFVSDELAFENARELADELETELLHRPATLEDLELLKLAYATQVRLEDRQRADRTRLERQREFAAQRDEAQARAVMGRVAGGRAHGAPWTRLSCHAFRHNAVRLQLHALAYNLAKLPADAGPAGGRRALVADHAAREAGQDRSRVVRHGRYVVFQLAEVALPRALFAEIKRRIDRLRPEPFPA